VPASVRDRPKQPYRAPDAISFFDSVTGKKARHAYVEELLSADCIRAHGIFDPEPVQKLVAKKPGGEELPVLSTTQLLVGILSTQLLIDQFVVHFEERSTHAAARAGSTPVIVDNFVFENSNGSFSNEDSFLETGLVDSMSIMTLWSL